MQFLKSIQDQLEAKYGVSTGLDIRKFIQLKKDHPELGSLLIHQHNDDIDLTVLLDRDIFEAWNCSARAVSVPCEEISHFVYLGYNHQRGRNITRLEMEIQSEVDRVLLAFHGNLDVSKEHQNLLYNEVLNSSYKKTHYEESRIIARNFLTKLKHPQTWSELEHAKLRKFFHSDLSEKLYLTYKT